jgi:F-type H+-transporting ATPase subunit b
MQLDLFTFIAQIINFIILIALLNKFLFKPIITAVDEREKRISEQTAEAEKKLKEASDKAAETEVLLESNRNKTNFMLEKGREQAESVKRELIDSAKTAAQDERNEWKKKLSEEKQAFTFLIMKKSADLCSAVSVKVLSDLSGTDLYDEMTEKFISYLGVMDKKLIFELNAALKNEVSGLVIRTTLPLKNMSRQRIALELKDTAGYEGKILFETSASIHGIELSAGGYTIPWTIENYLSKFDDKIRAVFEEKAGGKQDG